MQKCSERSHNEYGFLLYLPGIARVHRRLPAVLRQHPLCCIVLFDFVERPSRVPSLYELALPPAKRHQTSMNANVILGISREIVQEMLSAVLFHRNSWNIVWATHWKVTCLIAVKKPCGLKKPVIQNTCYSMKSNKHLGFHWKHHFFHFCFINGDWGEIK